jgi:predicted nuclease with TOPRIM domain
MKDSLQIKINELRAILERKENALQNYILLKKKDELESQINKIHEDLKRVEMFLKLCTFNPRKIIETTHKFEITINKIKNRIDGLDENLWENHHEVASGFISTNKF